ncbi:hypothetical protein NESM_000916100 [Novymonas esmeraldas]|uniref:Uncharacterized protein n=1 Tax=Novymonas esmeraldas TaxID=1808958 RepID=A0AAW0F034_9TRYP
MTLRLSISSPTVGTFTWIDQCTSLTRLGLQKCTFEIDFQLLREVPHLTTLDIRESYVRHLHGVQHRMELKKIDVTRCSRLESLEGLAGAPQLQSIEAVWSGAETIGELHRCPHLTRVNFRSCDNLRSLVGLVGAPSLHTAVAPQHFESTWRDHH